VSTDTRSTGASIMLAVDGLFLAALLFIDFSSKRQHLELLRKLGVGAPAWPDAGAPPGPLLPWAAAATLLAAILLRIRVPPLPPFFLLAGAILATAFALSEMAGTGATAGRYGVLTMALALFWIAHLLGAMVALGRGVRCRNFVALQAAFGIGLAALVFPG